MWQTVPVLGLDAVSANEPNSSRRTWTRELSSDLLCKTKSVTKLNKQAHVVRRGGMKPSPSPWSPEPPGRNKILHRLLNTSPTWQICRLWRRTSEFEPNSKISCARGLVICDTCAHLPCSDDKWEWIGLQEIARVQRFQMGVAKREYAAQTPGSLMQMPLSY